MSCWVNNRAGAEYSVRNCSGRGRGAVGETERADVREKIELKGFLKVMPRFVTVREGGGGYPLPGGTWTPVCQARDEGGEITRRREREVNVME